MHKQRGSLAFAATALALALGAGAASAASGDPGFELAQMIANQGGFGKATVLLGKLPAEGLGTLPLPAGATLVGSVAGPPLPAMLRRFGGSNNVTLYYQVASSAVAQNYAKTLAAAGWKSAAFPSARIGGFVDSNAPGREARYCGPGHRSVAFHLPQGSPDELVISVSTENDATSSFLPCASKNGLAGIAQLAEQFRAPLPQLHAPAGAEMEGAMPFASPFQSSTAYLKTALAPDALLAAFASEFTAGGWLAQRKAAGDGIATQSFTHSSGGKVDWRAALTVDRGASLDYAYIIATPENR
ncbi:MAG TPA: hypothetical protein VIG32_11330 [Candidatus Baltobacteraceae bacterium]